MNGSVVFKEAAQMQEKPIEYDRYGRMKYNPSYHENTGKPWTTDDLEYLINWYYKIGTDEMMFALGRPATTICGKVNELKKNGLMKKPAIRTFHRRTSNNSV
ncbi:hypothetical protein [Clostridium tagluense]|uniref:hypothetical protein n=1 Tax=Clostridium tagluense TaxID=360422 RepID=UPI001CF38931|nr:hypothetical protein [Clostridium tagluense]MCB2297765.1 hypothetical protein [Clostridium tagluense]